MPSFSIPVAHTGVDTTFEDAFYTALDRMIADSGGGITVYSGRRSTDRQAKLWEDALKKYGSVAEARKWVAPPGRSNHEKGLAADLRFASPKALAWAHANAARYGLSFPLSNENWHIEPLSARGGRSVADKSKGATKPPTPSRTRQGGQAMDFASIYALLKRNGATDTEARQLSAIALAESAGDPTAIGDRKLQNEKWGPSIGLFQVRSLKGESGRGTARDSRALSSSLDHQARAALEIARTKRGFDHWTTYTSGKSAKFLSGTTPGLTSPMDTSVELPPTPTGRDYGASPSTSLTDYGASPRFPTGWPPLAPDPVARTAEIGAAFAPPAAWRPSTPDPIARTQELGNAFPLPIAEAEAIQKRILAESTALAQRQQAEYQRMADLERSRTAASQQFVNQGLAGVGDMTAAATLANRADSAAAAQAAIAQLAQAANRGMDALFPGGAQGVASSIGQILQADVGQRLLAQTGQAQLAEAQRQYETNQQFDMTEAQARYSRAADLLGNASAQDRLNVQSTNQSRKDAYDALVAARAEQLRGALSTEQAGVLATNQSRKDTFSSQLSEAEQTAADRRSVLGAAVDVFGTESANTRQANSDEIALYGTSVDALYKDVTNRLQAEQNLLRSQEAELTRAGQDATEAKWEIEARQVKRKQLDAVTAMLGATPTADPKTGEEGFDSATWGANWDPTANRAVDAFYDGDRWVGFDPARMLDPKGEKNGTGKPSMDYLTDEEAGNLIINLAVDNKVYGKDVPIEERARDLAMAAVYGRYFGTGPNPAKDPKTGKLKDEGTPIDRKTGRLNLYHPLRAKIEKEVEAKTKQYVQMYQQLTIAPDERTDKLLRAMLGQAEQNRLARLKSQQGMPTGAAGPKAVPLPKPSPAGPGQVSARMLPSPSRVPGTLAAAGTALGAVASPLQWPLVPLVGRGVDQLVDWATG